MASYNDIPLPANTWTPVPVAAEDTFISPVTGDVRLSSNPDGVGGSGILLIRGTNHRIGADTALWVRPAGPPSDALARITA